MTAQVRQLRPSQPHTVVVVPDDSLLFGRTYRPVCTHVDREAHEVHEMQGCPYSGPFVSSERRAFEIGLEHTRKANGVWRPAW